jgi:hypothetical protein
MLEILKALRFLVDQPKQIEIIDEEILAGITNNKTEETHGDFLWLLILDLLIFIGLTVLSYQASLKIEENTQNSEDPNSLNKLKFIKGLSYANGGKNKNLDYF